MYKYRHNRIVNLLFEKIAYKNNECLVLKDKVKPNLFNSILESFNHHNTSPDIVVVDEESEWVIINEICTPYIWLSYDHMTDHMLWGKKLISIFHSVWK